MKLHNLKPAEGSVHKAIRIGRGEASGKGGTSTKGNKGGQSRAGYKSKMAHEGGQMPMQRRLPKRGFKSHLLKFNAEVTLTALQRLGAAATHQAMETTRWRALVCCLACARQSGSRPTARGGKAGCIRSPV